MCIRDRVGSSPWTLATSGSTQGVPRSSSDPSLVPPQFKKLRTPPPRTVIATTCTKMYLRHTSQDVTVTSPSPGLTLNCQSPWGWRVPQVPEPMGRTHFCHTHGCMTVLFTLSTACPTRMSNPWVARQHVNCVIRMGDSKMSNPWVNKVMLRYINHMGDTVMSTPWVYEA